MRNIILYLLISFFSLSTFAQQSVIRGSVKFEGSEFEIYQIKVQSRIGKELKTIAEKSFNVPDFEMKVSANVQYVVRFVASGYHDIDIDLKKSNTQVIDLGELYFKLNYKQLDSLVVTARRPTVRMKGSKMIVDVKNTILSDMGTVMDMLLSTPGLKQGNSGVEVPGRGVPLFVVDDREIKQTDILNVLKSDNVESIEIDRNPSSIYSASTKAVVRIKTIRGIQDHIFMKVNNLFSVKRKVSETPSLDFRFKKGVVSSFLTYMYSNGGSLLKEAYYREIYHPDYIFTSVSEREIPNRYQSHRFIWSTDIDLTKKSRIGVVYYFYHRGGNADEFGNTTLMDNSSEIHKYLERRGYTNQNTHSVSLSYNLKINGNSQLYLIGDYATVHNNNNFQSKEINYEDGFSTDIQTIAKSRYDVYTTRGQYDFKLPYKVQTKFGGKYSYVRTPSFTHSDNPYLNNGNYKNSTNVNDHNIASFFTASREWKKFSIELGVRYEYVTTEVFTRDNEDEQCIRRYYSDFFPNAQLSYTFNKDWNLSLNYSRYTSRPGYYALNPSLVYKDSLSYDNGNATLRPSFTHDLSLYLDWKNWSLSFSYSNTKDEIVQVLVAKDKKSNVTSSVPLNFSTVQSFSSGLSYRKVIKKFNLYGGLQVFMPYAKYPFMNEVLVSDMISWETQLNVTYTLNKKYAFYTNFSYSSRREYINMYQKSVNQWNIGMRGKFLKSRLTMDLQVMDLLHGSNYNNLYDSYLNIKDGTRGTSDFRGVKLTLSYILFNNDIKVKAERDNEEILRRTSK